MDTRNQYRVTVGDRSQIHDEFPAWSETFHTAQERGLFATLEKRLITQADPDWLAGLKDEHGLLPAGSIVLEGVYVGGWELVAATTP